MSKDFKDKYERVCSIKDKALCLVESQINGDISSVDAKELGEVADIAKDMGELMKYCAEAEYYHKVTESMDEASSEEKSYYLNKYIPEYEGKFYTPVYTRMYEDYPTKMRDYDRISGRMYYTDPSNMAPNRDSREGRSGISRRMYMEAPDKGHKVQELEHYMKDLSEDVTEMISMMEPDEKASLKQKMVELANKIV